VLVSGLAFAVFPRSQVFRHQSHGKVRVNVIFAFMFIDKPYRISLESIRYAINAWTA